MKAVMENNVIKNGLHASLASAFTIATVLGVTACTPTVKVQAPDKPIEINMNIKIEQEVRVKVDKDLDDAFASDPALFGGK